MPRLTFFRNGSAGAAARRGREGIAWFGTRLLDLVYPPSCVWCDGELPPESPGGVLCAGCCRRLAPSEWAGCRRCGANVPEGLQRPENCPRCRKFHLHFDTASPLGLYNGELREVVLRTKRLSCEPLATALGQLLAERRGDELAGFRPDLIVPIPMHWWRRFWRGVNNAEILAHCLGRRLGQPVARRLLIRRRPTRPQKDLRPEERFANVRDAFRLRPGEAARCRGSHVLLVDDILTTGATSSEAARMFKRAGAAAVAVAVLARA